MTTAIMIYGRRFVVAFFFALTVAGATGKPTYLHTTVGCYDVVSGMSEKDTRNLLIELMEIRQAIKDITGSPVIFEPNTQILIFASQKEMDEFYPKREIGLGYTSSIKWAYNTSKAGDVIALVGEKLNQKHYRESGYGAFGRYLLARMIPECPAWIYGGLSEYLCTVRNKDGLIQWGEPPYIEPGRVRAKPDTPFAVMMTGSSYEYNANIRGIWHYWLTSEESDQHANIRRLIEAIRLGEPGHADTVGRIFNVPVDELEQSVFRHTRRLVARKIERPAATGNLVQRLELKPATDDEIRSAKLILAGTIKEAPSRFYNDLVRFAAEKPHSPKPFEALARRAIEERDEIKAAEYWQQARDLGSDNPYAYLVLVRQKIGPRAGKLHLQPVLMPDLVAEMRATVDRCIQLNPGELEAYQWMAWIEALAPDPQATRLQLIDDSRARFVYPGVYLPTAAAYIRLAGNDQAKALLEEYLKAFDGRGNNKQAAEFLLKKITASN